MKTLLAIAFLLCATTAFAQQPSQARIEGTMRAIEQQRDMANTNHAVCAGSFAELQAENAALKKELESLKPKPEPEKR